MKTLSKLCMAASLLVLAACSTTDNGGAKMENYDEQAPYAHERTVGSEQAVKADTMYNTHQNK